MRIRDPVYIVGPTAVGKTDIAIRLAISIDGEILSADSMQVYRGMDIGTAKPSSEQLNKVRHHLINILNLDETFSVAKFKKTAGEIIQDIIQRHRIPIVVGGTGLYVKSLTEGIFEGPSADWNYRAKLRNDEDEHGNGYLYNELKKVDPKSTERIESADMRRIIRALEVYHLAGKPISELQTEWEQNRQDARIIGLYMERSMLNNRINKRVDDMFSQGLVEETKRLIGRGIKNNRTAMQAIGYKEVVGYIDGEYSIDRARELLKRNSRRYAKRQLTWFRKDNRIKWFDAGCMDIEESAEQIWKYLYSSSNTTADKTLPEN